uniref:Small secretory peptide n=1 Tax=Argas monolakensis TaxID=34602 RepID=Q09JT0_ARGMO|nr:small secretory peptide [Argas monolakensis]
MAFLTTLLLASCLLTYALGLPAPQEQGTDNNGDFGQLGTPEDIASSIAAWQATSVSDWLAANPNATTTAPATG